MSKTSTTSCGCHATADQLTASTDVALRRVLVIVLVINLVLFAGEFAVGAWIYSSGLQADALDSLGDASVYALSLYVVGRSLRWRAGAALFKGAIQAAFGLLVLVEVVRRLLGDVTPTAPVMAAAAAVALIANLSCFLLLNRYRDRDINLRSAWLCSRNDLVSNSGVIVAAGAVALVGNGLPDALIGALIATLFLHTSVRVLRDAWRQWRQPDPPKPTTCTPSTSTP
ncbi:MAG: cation transporter [Rhodanobacteraceae bacterium]|nr:cation transporter [Rhodanobacteraceae bacterium]MBP9155877.1 cation transporter [Xanthomonadales bacterium]